MALETHVLCKWVPKTWRCSLEGVVKKRRCSLQRVQPPTNGMNWKPESVALHSSLHNSRRWLPMAPPLLQHPSLRTRWLVLGAAMTTLFRQLLDSYGTLLPWYKWYEDEYMASTHMSRKNG